MFDIKVAKKYQYRYFSFSVDTVGGRHTISVDGKPIHTCQFLPKGIELTERGEWIVIEPEYCKPAFFNPEPIPAFYDIEILECNFNDGGLVDYD